jgi:glyoxylase-like metal-dependent hydrolase (beta-lactamase superfamily II)
MGHIGDFMPIFVTSIEGNSQKLDGGSMFGNAPRPVWEKWLEPDVQGRVKLACRSMLVEIDGTKILCEAGIGAFFAPKLAERFGVQDPTRHVLLDNLAILGLTDADIDYVVLSHLHFDHAGGILPKFSELQDNPSRLLFPKAKFVVGRDAYARSLAPHKRDRASFIPNLSETLAASNRLLLVDGAEFPNVAVRGLSFRYSDGHTPGHMHTLVSGKFEKIFFCGDMVPGIPWLHIPITMGYDRFPEKLIDEKMDILSEAARDNWRLFYTHDPLYAASKCAWEAGEKLVPRDLMKELTKFEI